MPTGAWRATGNKTPFASFIDITGKPGTMHALPLRLVSTMYVPLCDMPLKSPSAASVVTLIIWAEQGGTLGVKAGIGISGAEDHIVPSGAER
jgi:hypothetical protein